MIARLASSKSYKKGEMIFLTGQASQILYIVHRGAMKQVRVAPSGREQIVRTLESGDFIGELALFSSKENEGYLEALEPAVQNFS